MKKENIPQKPVKDVLDDFFSKPNDIISEKAKKSIEYIYYNKSDRIIILATKHGKEIIWRRKDLVEKYGWFFFVVKSQINHKEEEKVSGEIEVKTEDFQVNEFEIPLTENKNMRPLYNTKEYHQYLNLIKKQNIKQKPIHDTLKDFFINEDSVPDKEKESIKKINYYQRERVIVIKSLVGDKMYENLKHLVQKYGWYFYITGVPVGESEISNAIDKIERKFTQDYFKEVSLGKNLMDSENIRLTLYPIALRPNYNCLILGIGQLNILLDCGIPEEFFTKIDEYIENLNELLKEEEKSKIILSKTEEERLNEIEKLRKLEENDENGEEIDREDVEEEPEDKSEKVHKINNESKIINSASTTSNLNIKEFTPKIDAIFISHSHFDHISGLKDFIKTHPDVPILCSRITLDLFLLRDSEFLKQEQHEEIEQEEYNQIVKNVIYVENGDKIEFKEKNCYLSFFHAGHMPGALMMLAKVVDFRFLFTGDYTYWDITPFAGTRRFLDQISRPIDFLLIDGSSAHEEFGDPQQHFHSLILFLEQKAEYGDISLIGADPSSLAITFMLKFWRHFRKKQLRRNYKKRPNIYVDLMVRKNIQVINHRYEYIYGPISRLIRDKANPFNSIKFRWFDITEKEFLRKRNNIIITHPPDLSYGIIRNIVNVVGRNPHNMVYLAGAIHEEPAMTLIKEKEEKGMNSVVDVEFSETWTVPFRALLLNTFVPTIKIKLHGDKRQMEEMIKSLEPKEVCFFHQSISKLSDAAKYVITLGVEKVS
ncbi:MAG: MBL fold metallo-hydrolase, partial [Candidatus Lokiarchaeota archaeon]